MRAILATTLGALLGAALAGCGSSATSTFSCDSTAMVGKTMVHTCTEDDGVPVSSVDALTADCTGACGTVVGACATKGLLGSCAIPSDSVTMSTATIYYYAGGGLTATAADLQCLAAGGAWTDGG